MYTPDRNIVRKIQNYDKDLFVVWNNRRRFFELRRKRPFGDQLITPITQSIYNASAPIAYTRLDERILWWLYHADGARQGNIKLEMMKRDSRWKQMEKDRFVKASREYRDFAKDAFSIYSTGKYKRNQTINRTSKNRYPTFSNYKKERFVAPDVQGQSSRLVSRSRVNARRAYGCR